MSKDAIDEISDDQIAVRVLEYDKLFRRVREHTDSDLGAWVVAQELKRVFMDN